MNVNKAMALALNLKIKADNHKLQGDTVHAQMLMTEDKDDKAQLHGESMALVGQAIGYQDAAILVLDLVEEDREGTVEIEALQEALRWTMGHLVYNPDVSDGIFLTEDYKAHQEVIDKVCGFPRKLL